MCTHTCTCVYVMWCDLNTCTWDVWGELVPSKIFNPSFPIPKAGHSVSYSHVPLPSTGLWEESPPCWDTRSIFWDFESLFTEGDFFLGALFTEGEILYNTLHLLHVKLTLRLFSLFWLCCVSVLICFLTPIHTCYMFFTLIHLFWALMSFSVFSPFCHLILIFTFSHQLVHLFLCSYSA